MESFVSNHDRDDSKENLSVESFNIYSELIQQDEKYCILDKSIEYMEIQMYFFKYVSEQTQMPDYELTKDLLDKNGIKEFQKHFYIDLKSTYGYYTKIMIFLLYDRYDHKQLKFIYDSKENNVRFYKELMDRFLELAKNLTNNVSFIHNDLYESFIYWNIVNNCVDRLANSKDMLKWIPNKDIDYAKADFFEKAKIYNFLKKYYIKEVHSEVSITKWKIKNIQVVNLKFYY